MPTGPTSATSAFSRRLRPAAGGPSCWAKVSSASGTVWSPTGNSLAYNDGRGIYLVSGDGGNPRQLVDKASDSLAFSRDGTKLFFVLRSGSGWQLWSVDVSSGERRFERPIEVPASATVQGLALHPDGMRLTTSVVTAREDIWILEGFRQPGSWWRQLRKTFE